MTTETEVKHDVTQEAGPATGRSSFAAALWHGLERLGRWTVAELSRSRVRTVVVGIILILVAAFIVQHSFWTFPLVIVGIIMLVVAWVGARMEGRLVLDWGDDGAGFELRARLKPHAGTSDPVLGAPAGTSTEPSMSGIDAADAVGASSSETIEGEAHTMEIDPAELRSIVAAIEQQAAHLNVSHRDAEATPVSAGASSTAGNHSGNGNHSGSGDHSTQTA